MRDNESKDVEAEIGPVIVFSNVIVGLILMIAITLFGQRSCHDSDTLEYQIEQVKGQIQDVRKEIQQLDQRCK